MTQTPVHLLDVNVAVALIDLAHVHHQTTAEWFDTPGRRWALSAFTENGLLRYFTQQKTLNFSVSDAGTMLNELTQRPGYHYQPILSDWHDLTRAFSRRLHGHRQITDAYLLGLAIQEGLVLATFDQAILHLAGEHRRHVYLLGASAANGKVA